MPSDFEIPVFTSEAEEAAWWASHQDLLLRSFERAAADGTLKRGTLATRRGTPTTTIRLDPEDIILAKDQAQRLGLKYQTYLKMILHQALLQQASK